MKNDNYAGKNRSSNRKKNKRSKSQAAGKQQNHVTVSSVTGQHRTVVERDAKSPQARHRPKWAPPKVTAPPIPSLVCSVCKKPITDLSTALMDKRSGEAAHFDCVREYVAQTEHLTEGEVVSYIGGGRFGIVYYENNTPRSFKIKKVIEWESPQSRAAWRDTIANHFSIT